MSIKAFQQLACPLDGEALQKDRSSWSCVNGHSFDVSNKGYINLLPVQHKRSLDPGDHKAMVASRQRFLNAGFYKPIADALKQTVLSKTMSTNTISCLDAGCGEGYYLRELAASSPEHSFSLLGLDISKWAILAAAKQDPRAAWVVASNANIPALAQSIDCVLCMFGFPVYDEFRRVLKPEGLYIQVDAGPMHLRELRDIIYPSIKEKVSSGSEKPEGLTQIDHQTVQFSISLAGTSVIADMLAMTPHFYRASIEGREKALALSNITLSVDVTISTFKST